MQELYLDRLLALEFDESDNGGYARRWACYAEILGFWGGSAFWDRKFMEVEGDGDWGNDIVKRRRWQNAAVERAKYEIAMLRLRVIFYRGRQYLRGSQNLRRLQRRGVRKMENEAAGSWESYKEDLEAYPRAVEWAVCETPWMERVSSSVAAGGERDAFSSVEMATGVGGQLNMVINAEGMLWKWEPSSLRWVALEASDEEDTSSGDVQNEGHGENKEVEDRWDWIENFLGPPELPSRRIESSVATQEEEPDISSGEVQNEGHDENEEVEDRPDWIANLLDTRGVSALRLESFAVTQEGGPDKLGPMIEQGTTEPQKKESLERTEEPNLTTHEQTLLGTFRRETVREPTGVGGGLFEGWIGFSERSNYQTFYDGAAELEQTNPSTEQDTFRRLQKMILQPESTPEARLNRIRQLTAYTYTSEDREKWTILDWIASREFWASEPLPLEKMLDAQGISPASDSTGESLLLELIAVGGSEAVLGGEKRTDSGVGLQDDDEVESAPSMRMAEQLGVFSQPDKTAEEKVVKIIQQQGMRAVVGESRPVQKVGWIMGRMVFYNPEEEELGDFCVRKIRRSTVREKSKQRPAPPISLTSFTCHRSTVKPTAKPPVPTPDRPSQVRDESTQPPTPPIPLGPVRWTGQPRHLAPYQPRHLSLPTKLVGILKPSSRGATQYKPSTSDPILDGAPLALFHPNPLAWYSEWVNSRTYAAAANDPAPLEAGKKSAMKKLGRRKKNAEHESPATEQDRNNVIDDEQRVLDREPGMPRVQSMLELFQLRTSRASIGVAVKDGVSRRDRGIAVGAERIIACPSPPPPPPSPPPQTPRTSMRKSRGRGTGRGKGRGVTYQERDGRNEQQSETAVTEGQDIIPEPDIPAVATEQALVEAGAAQLTVNEAKRQTNDTQHEHTEPEQNRNNEAIIDQMAHNGESGITNDEHGAELSQLDAYRESLGVAIEYVNGRQDRERDGRKERGQSRGRSRGGTFRDRYPRKWQQMQAAAIEGQRIISKPVSSTSDTLVQMAEQEPVEPGQEESLEALEEQSDHPPVSSTDSRIEQRSRLASLGLEDYASDQSEEDADGEAPLASSNSKAYANACSLIAEQLVRVSQPGVTSVQTWAQIVQRETPQEPTARVEAKLRDDRQDVTKTVQQPQSATTEVREIVSRPKRDRSRGRGKGVAYRGRQPRNGQQLQPALLSTQDISEENERRHICMYNLAATQDPDAIAELLAQRAAIRDRLVWMSDGMADKGTTRDQRIRMVAVGWCRWFNWKDRGGTGSFSFDEEDSFVDLLNAGGFGSHLPLVQPASSAATAANAPIMPGNSAALSAPSASAVPRSDAPAASSSVLSRAEHKSPSARRLNEARDARRARARERYAAGVETITEDSTEKPSTSLSQDKGKMKTTDFTTASVTDAKGPDTTSEDTALETTELDEVERIDDAQQWSASSAATASNTPVISGNSATPSVSAVPSSAALTAPSSFMSEAELLRHMKRNRASAERKAKKKAAAKAETNTNDEMERPSTSSSRDKGKMKATDFRGVPIPYVEGPDTTPEDTALEMTELDGVKRITEDAGQGTASSAATAINAPIMPGNAATPSASSTSAVHPSAISTAASPDNWLIRLMRNISPDHHEGNRPNARGRARQKAYANAEANTDEAIEKPSTSLSQDKGKMKATNFTGAPIPISYVTDEMKAAERNQIDELAELGGPEAVTGDSMKVQGDARGTSQDTSLVPLTEGNEHDTKEEAPPSPIRDAAEPRSRNDSTRRVIWGPDDPVAYGDFWNSAPKPPPEVPHARTESGRTAEVPFGMIEIDGSFECIGEVEKAQDEARRIGQDERFEPNAHQERRTVCPDGTVKFIIQPMFKPPFWNIDHRRPAVVIGGVDMAWHSARELSQLREQEAKNATKERIGRTTRGEEGRHAVREVLNFPAFRVFTTARVDEEKLKDDACRIGLEELFEVEEGSRISVQLPPKPDSSCSSDDNRTTHLVGFSDNSEMDNN